MLLTKNFIQNVVGAWGEAGSTWLETLSSLVSYCAEKWQLTNLSASPNLSFNYIVFAQQNNNIAVALKLSMPTLELHREINVLNHFAGQGSVKLLDSDIAKGALLLQALQPGKSLKLFFPDQDHLAVEIAAQVIQKIHSHPAPPANEFLNLQDWLKTLEEPNKDIPHDLLEKARIISRKLLTTQGHSLLLHGDLHHDNILLNGQDEWLAIDPKGVIGEPAYEVGAFIRNPMPQILLAKNPSDMIGKRFEQFATLLQLEKERLIGWSFVQSILAACWSIEDNDPNAGRWVECANLIKPFTIQRF